jgi:hypothetical protein
MTWLVRAVTYGVPTLVWTKQGQAYALTLALFLGAVDGWFRLRVGRTARSLVADADALTISSGLDSTRIPWSNVLAVEVWHRLNRLDYVAVHYETATGNSVATCWEQGDREALLRFVQQCATQAQAAEPRKAIVRARLGDRAVYVSLLRRLSLDLALALLVGMLCGIASHALWLGAAAALSSGLLAATPYLHGAELVHRDGVWWQRRGNGKLAPLRGIPQSLRLWAGHLSE